MLELLHFVSRNARILTAVLPFAIAMGIRFVYGRSRLTQALISIGTAWFAVNVLLTPYSDGMQRDLAHVRSWFR